MDLIYHGAELTISRKWKPADNTVDLVLYFYLFMSPDDPTQVNGLGNQSFTYRTMLPSLFMVLLESMITDSESNVASIIFL